MTQRPPENVPVPPGFDPASVVLTFRVPNELDGQRLDRFVQWRIPRLTRSRAEEIVRACAAHADGRRRDPSDRVFSGETVLLVRERFVEPDAPRHFGVLFEDEALVVVDKPAGLPVHPSATFHRNTLTALLTERYGERVVQIAHRLDKETSGIVVCARLGPDEANVKAQFAGRGVEKAYLALVRGRVEGDERVIELPLRRAMEKDVPVGVTDLGAHMLVEVHPEGAPAKTTLRVLERRGALTLVHLVPETGRQHQLRVHLAAIGHPILGDKLYGPDGAAIFAEIIERGMTPDILERLGHPRHALHAHRLALTHPRSGARLELVSPLPPDLEQRFAQGA